MRLTTTVVIALVAVLAVALGRGHTGAWAFAPPTLPAVVPHGVPATDHAPARGRGVAPTVGHTVLLEVHTRLQQRKADGAAASAAPADAGTDQLQSHLPYYQSTTPAHEITSAERQYTPEGQLDALAEEHDREVQAAQLQRFRERLDTQILVKQANRLTARTAAVANAPAPHDRFVGRDGAGAADEHLTPLTSASTANVERTAEAEAAQAAADAQDRNWLGSMRLASARSEQAAANAIRETARQQQRLSARHHHRHGHGHGQRQRHKHALNLGQRVASHNRAAGRTAGRALGQTGHGVRVGDGDDGGDVEDEKYMATDEAKGQEIEYEPDESSNNWWWDYWAPYIA